MLRAQVTDFKIEERSKKDLDVEQQRIDVLRSQQELFNSKSVIPYKPCPYRFKYRYQTDDGKREGTCQDWEIEATFFNWANLYGEERALAEMAKVFGEEYPSKGMLFAMGTHSQHPETWLINGIVRLDEVQQLSLL